MTAESTASDPELQRALASRIGSALNLPYRGVQSVIELFDDNATIPFIARYRKEATGNLDEVQIRDIRERLDYLRELDSRRATILKSIDEQGKLSEALRKQIEAVESRQELEDIYLPYRPRRRTRAMMARERGLQELADRMRSQSAADDPQDLAARFAAAHEELEDAAAALAGARDIIAEELSEDANVRAWIRKELFENANLSTTPAIDPESQRTKFEQYYDFQEPVATIPSHRFLAIRRGEREGVLRTSLQSDEERILHFLESQIGLQASTTWHDDLKRACREAWRRLLSPSVETDIRVELKQRADREAVDIFARNLSSLLMAAPLGQARVFGIDPGLRTGCKLAVVDETGAFVDNTTLYLSGSASAREAARRDLLQWCARFKPNAIAIGNGTAGRETEAFVRETIRDTEHRAIIVIMVSEAGASVYSASEVAREEFPELDLTVRGAISIARRLQDPLAELVKVDPRSIGVGQYQHDVQESLLARKLDEVVESCVNAVGVELNTASAPLLAKVAGIGPTLATRIVEHRNQSGAFRNRSDLLKVSGLGPRTFEQCAGFLRLRSSTNPLDRSAVHPESYPIVERIAADLAIGLDDLVGSARLASQIDVARYESEGVGALTLRDIIEELKKPGRDPRSSFEAPAFRDDVRELDDLKLGMVLEGVVTNVTAFGAFVDVGVHQDGLVHISKLADRFVRDPNEVVATGDRLTVKVLDVDIARKRISLSARLDEEPEREARSAGAPRSGNERRPEGGNRSTKERSKGRAGDGRQQSGKKPRAKTQGPQDNFNTPFADLLKKR